MEWFPYLELSASQRDKSKFECKVIENTAYLENEEGFALALHGEVLKYITIYLGYEGVLPYGIEWDQTNSNIVRRLGEPDKKVASKALGIEITYIDLGISFEFVNCDWEDMNNPMRSIILFKGTIENPFIYPKNCTLCSFCHAVGHKICGACRLFFYCSRSCQVSHWPIHKSQCRLITQKQ